MKVQKIYIGGWFQRTTLQLSEIYDFLRWGTSRLDLNKRKLTSLHTALSLSNVEYGISGLEYIEISTRVNIVVKIFEDGLIVLGNTDTTEDTISTDIEEVADYYENKLSPAISYLFSLGAPVPKELANIETVYPYFIVVEDATKEDMDRLLMQTDKEQYFSFQNDRYDVMRGDKYYFINNKKKDDDRVERYIEEQVFIREFKSQLHHYLNLHRIIWEKIAIVKENADVKGKDILKFSSKIDGYAKTINLVDARINQMNTYLKTREKIAKSDTELEAFLDILGYRYETLGNTLVYMQQLWKMTQNYVNSAATLFKSLRQDITSKSVNNLTVVTSMGVGASLIGLFTTAKVPNFTVFGFVYFFCLAVFGYAVKKILKYISENRQYHISDIDYDKNIK